jgi:hypothetical protein
VHGSSSITLAIGELDSMFKPWIGKNYNESPAPKILILGESQYGNSHVTWDYPLEEKNILTIQQQIDDSWRSRFHTKIVSGFLGHRPSVSEKGKFWNSVAYHNLITEPLEAARIAPTKKQWEDSLEALPQVIEELSPNYCVVLGYRMWGQFSNKFDFSKIKTVLDIGKCGAVYSESMQCVFHGIKHPSGRGYKTKDIHAYINNLKKEKWG